ncbi:MAG: DNA polymerase IV [Myxococcales bacterium]
MDAFYASVEQRDDPALRGRPVIVGGHPKRGVVLAASYEVRPFGVRSAMPMARALALAPQAVVVPPRFTAYVEASARVFEIFESVTPLVEGLSLDEAFLDVTASAALFGAPAAVAARLRRRIREELELPASAGIAPVKFVAKIASDLAKPDGQREVGEGQVRAFLAPLPVARLWGVGPRTEETLHRLGLRTLGDVAACAAAELEAKLGAGGPRLRELALGLDDRPVVPDRQQKSLGAEDTFEEDLEGEEALRPHLHAQALRVGRRLRRAGLVARVVVLKHKLSDFTLLTRRKTLPEPTDDGQILYREALALARELPRAPVRLTGVSAHELAPRGSGQLGLFGAGPSREGKLNAALDAIADRFGAAAITTADLKDRPERDDDGARRLVGAARFDGSRR